MLPIASESKSTGLLSRQIRGRGDPFFLAKSAGDGARMRRRRSSSGTSNDPDTAKNVFLNSSCLLKTKGIKRTYCSEMRRERERARAGQLAAQELDRAGGGGRRELLLLLRVQIRKARVLLLQVSPDK